MIALAAAVLGASLGILVMGMISAGAKARAFEDGVRAAYQPINRPRTADTAEGMDMKE